MSEQRANRRVKSLEEEIAGLEQRQSEGENLNPPESAPFDNKEVERPKRREPEKTEEDSGEGNEAPLSKEEETFKKRYRDLQSYSSRQINALKEEIETLKNAVAQPTKSSAPLKTKEEVEAWMNKNPDAASIIISLAKEQVGSVPSDLERRLKEIEDMKEQIGKEKEESKILSKHPDYKEITTSDEFLDWAESQPEYIQDAIFDGTSEQLIHQLTLYKKEAGIKSKDSEKDAAKSVKSKSRTEPRTIAQGRFSESMVARMPMHEYEKNAAAIDEEIRNGTFVYDLSGAR